MRLESRCEKSEADQPFGTRSRPPSGLWRCARGLPVSPLFCPQLPVFPHLMGRAHISGCAPAYDRTGQSPRGAPSRNTYLVSLQAFASPSLKTRLVATEDQTIKGSYRSLDVRCYLRV